MERFIIVLTGAPGSGKGYLCDCLIAAIKERSRCKIDVISTGDLIRAELKGETELGKKLKEIVEAGALVSDDIIAQLVRKKLETTVAEIIIFDGYPRTGSQLKDFCDLMKDENVCMIHRETPEEVILERVSKRRICKSCGKVQSADQEKCLLCGGELGVRKDDAVIEQRLAVYKKETQPALKLLGEVYKTARYSLDGAQDAKESVEAIIDDLLLRI